MDRETLERRMGQHKAAGVSEQRRDDWLIAETLAMLDRQAGETAHLAGAFGWEAHCATQGHADAFQIAANTLRASMADIAAQGRTAWAAQKLDMEQGL